MQDNKVLFFSEDFMTSRHSPEPGQNPAVMMSRQIMVMNRQEVFIVSGIVLRIDYTISSLRHIIVIIIYKLYMDHQEEEQKVIDEYLAMHTKNQESINSLKEYRVSKYL